jgi:hypothetical protein
MERGGGAAPWSEAEFTPCDGTLPCSQFIWVKYPRLKSEACEE